MAIENVTSLQGTTVRRPWRVVAATLAVLALLGAACGDDTDVASDGDSSATSTEVDAGTSLLGEPAPAEGEPVKLGFIYEGKASSRDATIDRQVTTATVEYVNEYRSGIAGQPIELVSCEALADPGRSVDCANQMVQADVVAVVVGGFANVDAVFDPLHDAGIPYIVYSASSPKLFTDPDSTFILTNTLFGLGGLPLSVAKEAGVSKISVVVIDLPVTTAYYKSIGAATFEAEGIELKLIPVAPGTADMTPFLQGLGDDTLVHVVGNDGFCIPAFNALQAVGFEGPVTTVSLCVTDATREQAPAELLDGLVVQATSPIGDANDPDMQLYQAILNHYASDQDVDPENGFGVSMFTTVMGLVDAVGGLSGEVTAETVLAAIKAMPQKELTSGGGVFYRCNGKAHPLFPALCGLGGLRATLDADGEPTGYEVVDNQPIPD